MAEIETLDLEALQNENIELKSQIKKLQRELRIETTAKSRAQGMANARDSLAMTLMKANARQDAFLDLIADNIDMIFAYTDENGKIVLASKSLADALGIPRGELQDMRYQDVIDTWEDKKLGVQLNNLFRQLRSDGTPRTMNLQIDFRGGKNYKDYRASFALAKDNTNRELYYLSIYNEVNDLVSTKENESSNNAKNYFLTNMNSEIYSPLNTVMELSRLELEKNNLPDETRNNIEKIQVSGNLLLQAVNDISDLSKIENGNIQLVNEKYDSPSLISDICAVNRAKIGSRTLEFKVLINENLPNSMLGDSLRIKQICNNLISNAIKFTKTGKVEFIVDVSAKNAPDTEGEVFVEFTVRDTGVGIKPEDQKRLFQVQNWIGGEANGKTDGTGLGLSITKHLVDMMNGEIKIQSEYGRGSKFSVIIPQKIVGDELIGAEVAGSFC
ncbi:hypothetical protein AGMMS49938_13720 [Fibrobacterales bacterium]|nr:hypothetical protein AGMMS49938_13720 [Fibrobacterales bacterium]